MNSPPTAPLTPSTTSLVLDAEALYRELLRGVRSLMGPQTQLAGITSGGAWLAERLHQDLGLAQPVSVLSSALHRDDFAQRGMAMSAQTQLHFDVNGADIVVLDDVLYTGRTVRAVINELYDYAAPAACAWPCWSIAVGASCRMPPTLLRPASACPPAKSWRWRVPTMGVFTLPLKKLEPR